MKNDDDPVLSPGQDNTQIMGLDFHNPVFPLSALAILLFIIYALVYPDAANTHLGLARNWSIEHFDWLFMIAGNIFVVFCLVLICLPLGRIRLGGKDATPEYSRTSWFAMLFAAGMGIGLMFWSVAEPVAYYTDWYGTPLNTPASTPEGASAAMGATMFHWGLHPWAIYGVVGLSLAFFAYNKRMPLTLRSAFYPLLGSAPAAGLAMSSTFLPYWRPFSAWRRRWGLVLPGRRWPCLPVQCAEYHRYSAGHYRGGDGHCPGLGLARYRWRRQAVLEHQHGHRGSAAGIRGRGRANPDDSDGHRHHRPGLRQPPYSPVELDWSRR